MSIRDEGNNLDVLIFPDQLPPGSPSMIMIHDPPLRSVIHDVAAAAILDVQTIKHKDSGK